MFGIGFSELVVIVLALFIIVGPKKTTEIAHSLGKWVADFRVKIAKIKAGFDDSSLYEPNVDLNKPLDQLSKSHEKS
jgi:Sec-independent protein translocase protein TatA